MNYQNPQPELAVEAELSDNSTAAAAVAVVFDFSFVN
jgi:hypothetical protein